MFASYTSPSNRKILARAYKQYYNIAAIGSPFESKDLLKENGFKWKAEKKVWEIKAQEDDVENIKKLLSSLYHLGGEQARIEKISIASQY